MTDIETQIRSIVRDELARAKAEAAPAEFLSARDAAGLIGVAEGTIRRWIREGKIDRHNAGRRVRVLRADLERLLRSGTSANDDSPEARADREFG